MNVAHFDANLDYSYFFHIINKNGYGVDFFDKIPIVLYAKEKGRQFLFEEFASNEVWHSHALSDLIFKKIEPIEKYIRTEIVLSVGLDAWFCHIEPNRSKVTTAFQFFEQFDYIGAPWHSGRIGNGGFTLRKKSFMIACLKWLAQQDFFDDAFRLREGEDMWYAACLDAHICKPNCPTFENAVSFSQCTLKKNMPINYIKPLGFHYCYIADEFPPEACPNHEVVCNIKF